MCQSLTGDRITIPYLLILGILFLLYFKFLMRLPARTRYLFIASGVLFILGAVGFEIIGNWLTQFAFTKNTLQYRLLYSGEEFLEIMSIIVFIYALFDYAVARFGSFSVCISRASAAAPSIRSRVWTAQVTSSQVDRSITD